MSAQGPKPWALRRLTVGAAALFVLLPIAHGLPPADVADALSIRRVVLPPERMRHEMERVRQGVLRQMPRDEFEELVRQATAAREASQTPPRLVAAHYRAKIESAALVGTAEWKMVNPLDSTATAPALLPLQPFNLAINQPRLGNQDAIIASFDGKSLGLLLDARGEQALTFDWSSRGEPTPAGVHFDLHVPSSAVATLELTLPADCRLHVAAEACVVSGPRPADGGEARLWSVGFAGQSQLSFTVQRLRNAQAPPPLLLCPSRSRQELSPDQLYAEFEFPIETVHQALDNVLLACDPALEPIEVESPGLAGWQFRRGLSGTSNTIAIQFHEPVTSGSIRVRALASLKTAKIEPSEIGAHREESRDAPAPLWRSPAIRVVDGVRSSVLAMLSASPAGSVVGQVPWGPLGFFSEPNQPRPFEVPPRGETLVLRLHPDLQLDDWRPDPFRIARATTDADAWQEWTLVGGVEGQSARPSARLTVPAADFRVRQLAWWQLAAGQESLTTQFQYEIRRGRLFEISLALPAKWDVAQVETAPAERLRGWTARTEGNRSRLVIQLSRPLTPAPEAATLNLTVTLRPVGRPTVPSAAAHAVPFPDIVPLGARFREGGLAIEFDERAYQPVVRASVQSAPPQEPGPWGRQTPDFYFAYRGQPAEGTLQLQPVPARLRAYCETEITLTPVGVAVLTRLRVEAQAGQSDSFDVTFSAPPPSQVMWKTIAGENAVRRVQRLPCVPFVAAPSLVGLGGLGDLARWSGIAPAGELWHVTVASPLRQPVVLESTLELVRPSHGEALPIPLPILPFVDEMEGAVRIDRSNADPLEIETVGLRDTAATATRDGNTPWRSFRYGAAPAALVFTGVRSGDKTPQAVIERARLTTAVQESGPLLHRFRFELAAWSVGTPMLVRLPANARPLAVQVDGSWLPQLPELAPDDPTSATEITLDLPVPSGSGAHRYEVVYSTPANAWTLWTALEPTSMPALPVRPRGVTRSWVLPRGVGPLLDGSLHPLPGGARTKAAAFFPASLPVQRFSHWHDAWLEPQRQAVQDAGIAVAHRHGDRSLTLGEAVERLAFEQLRDERPLVLDASALAAAGIGPHTPLPRDDSADAARSRTPFWEAVGLTYLPCRAGPVLTTRQQGALWEGLDEAAPFSGSLADAVAEAARFGRDASGRFRTVPDWLRLAAISDSMPSFSSNRAPTAGEPVDGHRTTEGSEWEAPAGVAPDALLLVRVDRVPVVAALLSLIPMAWLILRRVRPSGTSRRAWRRLSSSATCVFGWLVLALAAFIWLPGSLRDAAIWPACLAALAVIADAMLPNLPRWDTSTAVARASVAGAAMALAGIALSAEAAGPVVASSPGTVYLLPGPPDAPDRQTVLLTPELADRLHKLARPGSMLPAAVLLSAEYHGPVDKFAADLEAVYRIRAFEQDAAFILPLDGVELREGALLDGGKAFPVALAPPQVGFSFRMTGTPGTHVLRVPFRAAVQGTGEDRSLRFGIPQTPHSRASFEFPRHVGRLQSLTGRGRQQTLQQAGVQRLDVELGRTGGESSRGVGTLHVTWREAPAPAVGAAPEFREAYLWTLRPGKSDLHAIVQYDLGQASVTEVTVNLPAGLALRQAEATRLADGGPLRLKALEVIPAAGRPRLRVLFQSAVSGGVQLSFDLVPLKPFGERASLTLPVPVGMPAKEGSLLAYRLEELDGKVTDNLYVTSVPLERFMAFWRSAGTTESFDRLLSSGGVYQFQRKAGETPHLELELRPHSPVFTVAQQLNWHLYPERADLQARVRLLSRDGDLSSIECDVPPAVQVGDIRGRDVRAWTRSAAKVHIWLQQSTRATEVELVAWTPLPRPAPADAQQQTIDTRFVLPCVSFPRAHEQQTSVRLRSASALALETETLRGLAPEGLGEALSTLAAAPGSSIGILGPLLAIPRSATDAVFVSRQSSYGAVFRVRSATPDEAKILCFAEALGRRLAFRAVVSCRARHGELRSLTLRVRNAEGADVKIEAPGLTQQRELPADPRGRSWVLDFKPGGGERCQVILSAEFPLDVDAAGLSMPDVTVSDALHTERWVAIAGRGVQTENVAGLLPLQQQALAAWSRPWPSEAERVRRTGGTVWQATTPDWRLRIMPTVPVADSGKLRVLLTHHAATLADDSGWLHEATYWLYQEAPTELRLSLPEQSRLVAAELDHTAIQPMKYDSEVYGFTFASSQGARLLRVLWTVEGESLAAPHLDMPRIGDESGKKLWTLIVPTGYESTAAAGTVAVPSAHKDVAEAEAYYLLSEILAGREKHGSGSPLLRSAQERFYQCCRVAEYGMSTAIQQHGDAGSLAPLADGLRQLRLQNTRLARSHNFEPLRAQAERRALTLSDQTLGALPWAGTTLVGRGRPTLWQAVGTPHLTLIADSVLQQRHRWAATLMLIVVLLGGWALSYVPPVYRVMRQLWPEGVALFGLLLWWETGPGWIAAAFLLVALTVRLAIGVRWFISLLKRPARMDTPTPTPAAS